MNFKNSTRSISLVLMAVAIMSVTSVNQDIFAAESGMSLTATADEGSNLISVAGETSSNLTDVVFRVLTPSGDTLQTILAIGTDSNELFDPVTNSLTSVTIDNEQVAESIKSLRTYQVGVVYVDKYGRETPIFTDPSGSLILDKMASINYNVISIRIVSTIPEWAESYKYFIKESSDEYYNLAMDRWYDAEDGNIWLTFPSTDRNKIDLDSVLILKKGPNSDELIIDPAKYKVIAIENEAPDYIKTKRTLIEAKQHEFGNDDTNIFGEDLLNNPPVSNTDLTRIASGYGYRMHPIYKIRKLHTGMDFTAPRGTEIYATGDGVIELAKWNSGYGKCVIIDHGFGYKTKYAHCKKLNCRKGQKIKKGEVIAFLGNTGQSTGPHLHYEVIKNNNKVNPVNYFFNDLSPEEYEKVIELSSRPIQSM